MKPKNLLKLPQVRARCAISRSAIYQRITDGTFPRPISVGARAVAWIEDEVDEWIERQVAASRASATGATEKRGRP
jgi:prophage regulatory protein